VGANGLIKASAGPDAVSKVHHPFTHMHNAHSFIVLTASVFSTHHRLRAIQNWGFNSTLIQETQLSQRNRVSFAKSLNVIEVIRNDTLEWDVCKSLLMFHCMSVSRTVSEIFSVE